MRLKTKTLRAGSPEGVPRHAQENALGLPLTDRRGRKRALPAVITHFPLGGSSGPKHVQYYRLTACSYLRPVP